MVELNSYSSSDLTSWTQRNVDTGAGDQWINSIIYDSTHSKYVAAGAEDTTDYDAEVWESADLQTWIRRDVDTGANDQWINSIIYDSTHSKYVAAGADYGTGSDAVVWESTDLISWIQRNVDTGADNQWINSIIYDSTNGKYVAGGHDHYVEAGSFCDAVVWESTDLISWIQRNVDTGVDEQWINSIIYDSTHSKYVAAGIDENATSYYAVVWESIDDLISWTQRNVDTEVVDDQCIDSIIYDSTNGKYVAAGIDNWGVVVWESTDLTSWIQRDVDIEAYTDGWISIVYDSTNSKYVVAGSHYDSYNDGNYAVVWESTDLTSWTQRNVDTGVVTNRSIPSSTTQP